METTDKNTLDERELRYAIRSGIHNVDKPITGYKKIKCTCEVSILLSFLRNPKIPKIETTTFAIAELEIPKGSTIIRSEFSSTDSDGNVTKYASRKLRTDRAILKKIENNSFFSKKENCVCYSIFDKNFKYKLGEEHKPERPFDSRIDTECVSGIHFFLNKDQAENYD